jgi:hypothetical protein
LVMTTLLSFWLVVALLWNGADSTSRSQFIMPRDQCIKASHCMKAYEHYIPGLRRPSRLQRAVLLVEEFTWNALQLNTSTCRKPWTSSLLPIGTLPSTTWAMLSPSASRMLFR